jgi:SAM-dependent methyltransferase
MQPDEVRSSYDMVAEAYAQKFFDELSRKPFDRGLLDDFAAALNARRTLDVGCGPGHVAGYLSERGLDATGVDLSPTMIKIARRLNPEIRFELADMRNLPVADGTVGGIAAFYSLIHIPREEVPAVLLEFRRVLIPSGRLLVAVHGGSGTITTQEFMGKQVPFEAILFEKDELVDLITAAGFEVTTATVREPYEFESQTPRLYVAATYELRPTPSPAAGLRTWVTAVDQERGSGPPGVPRIR